MTLYDCLVELHGVEKILSFPFDGLVVKTNELTNSVGSVTFVIICDASILCSSCFNRSRGVCLALRCCEPEKFIVRVRDLCDEIH